MLYRAVSGIVLQSHPVGGGQHFAVSVDQDEPRYPKLRHIDQVHDPRLLTILISDVWEPVVSLFHEGDEIIV